MSSLNFSSHSRSDETRPQSFARPHRVRYALFALSLIRRRIWTSSLPELVVLLLAALPRFWRLEYHSFWFDEAVSLAWARADAADIWRVTLQLSHDKHPPGYYLALHSWQGLLNWFGLAERDAALRIFGVLMGILMVWGILRLATQISGRATGLLTGLFAALAPVLVWYSQELRMFQPAATTVVWALSFLLAARGHDVTRGGDPTLGKCAADAVASGWAQPSASAQQMRSHRVGRIPLRFWHEATAAVCAFAECQNCRVLNWLGFTVTLLFSLYSYLYAAFFLPGLGLSLLLLARRGKAFDRRYFLEGSAALAVVAALFLPLARNAWGVNSAESTPGAAFADFLPNLWRQLTIFTVWYTSWPSAFKVAAIFFFAVLVLAGLILPGNSRLFDTRRPQQFALLPSVKDARLLLWLWIGAPLLIGNLLLTTNAAIFREDRYFLFLAPFVLWAAARGVGAIRRLWPPAGNATGVAAVALLAAALPVLWTPLLFRENWRAAADYISAYRQHSFGSASAVLVHPYFLRPALEWYLQRETTSETPPVFGNFGGPLTPQQAEAVIAPHLQEIAASTGADTLWLVQSHLAGVDDQRLVQAWLDANFPLITEQYPAGVDLRGYAVRYRYPTLPALPDMAVYPLDKARPHGEGALAALSNAAPIFPGVELAACEIITPVVAARDFLYHPPGGWVHLRLWLRAYDVVEEEPTILALVQSGDGNVWGRSLERAGDVLAVYPPTIWKLDEIVRVELDVNLNPLARPGFYNVTVEAAGEAGVPCGRVRLE